MTIKCLAAGNLFGYFMSPRNYKGEMREMKPVWLGDPPVAATDLLNQLAPPHVKQDKKRRWVGHCRRNLTHLIIGFAEGHKKVEPFLGCVVRATECLVLAGLPRTSLEFVWCHHPQTENSHLHCGLVRSLLPGGGAYQPKLPFGLAADFSWLVSWRLGLDLPVDRARTRLVRGGEFSYKDENRECIRKICKATQVLFKKDSSGKPLLSTHQDFLDLLRKHAKEFDIQEILVVPDKNGRPVRLTASPMGRIYPRSVAVRGPRTIIWLQGPVCRQEFNLNDWQSKLQKQQARFEIPDQVFARFKKSLKARINQQRARYQTGRPASELVGEDYFEWLNPKRPLRVDERGAVWRDLLGPDMPLPRFPVSQAPPGPELSAAELVEYAPEWPEATYPFYSDPDDLKKTDLTDLPAGFDEYPEDNLEEEYFWPFPSLGRDVAANPPESTFLTQLEHELSKLGEILNVQSGQESMPDHVGGQTENIGARPSIGSPSQAEAEVVGESKTEDTKTSEPQSGILTAGLDPHSQLTAKERHRKKLQLEISNEIALECEDSESFMNPNADPKEDNNQTEQNPGLPTNPSGPDLIIE